MKTESRSTVSCGSDVIEVCVFVGAHNDARCVAQNAVQVPAHSKSMPVPLVWFVISICTACTELGHVVSGCSDRAAIRSQSSMQTRMSSIVAPGTATCKVHGVRRMEGCPCMSVDCPAWARAMLID